MAQDEKQDGSKSVADDSLKDLFAKDEITIVITDIGLGGMSVFDDIENEIRQSAKKPFKKISLVFWNAQLVDRYTPHPIEEQITRFSKQLESMSNKYNPDLILIACNTLSVIYDQTDYYKASKIPVLSIVGFTTNIIENRILSLESASAASVSAAASAAKDNKNNDNKNDSLFNSIIMIYGTTTTAKVGKHKSLLLESKKLSKYQKLISKFVLLQGCPGGATTIQGNGPYHEKTEKLIESYVNNGFKQIKENNLNIDNNTKIFACLCCTHYGYSYNLWLKYTIENLKNLKINVDNNNNDNSNIEIINPNKKMAEFVSNNELSKNGFDKCDIKLTVVSPNVLLEDTERDSIAALLNKPSADVLKACKGEGSHVMAKGDILKQLQKNTKL